MSRLALILFACMVSGCASLTTGQNQTIAIEAANCPEASCILSNDDGTFFIASTPGETEVNKSCKSLKIKCSKRGYPDHAEEVGSGFQAMTIGNALIGGLVGVGVDMVTGAACTYPKLIPIAMDCSQPPLATDSESAMPIPTLVSDLASDQQCDEVAFVQQGSEGERYFSTVCQGEDRLITCFDTECVLQGKRFPAEIEEEKPLLDASAIR